MMESYVRCRARDRKQQISDNFILSKALTLNIRNWKQNLLITGTSADGGLMNLTDEGSRECNPAYFIVRKGGENVWVTHLQN